MSEEMKLSDEQIDARCPECGTINRTLLGMLANAPAHADEPVAPRLNVQHPDCHKAADAFWKYWRDNGDTHKHGYYESTWGAINAALKLVGVVTTPRVQACRPEDRAMLTGAAGQELVKCAIAEMSAHPSAGIRSEVMPAEPTVAVPVGESRWLIERTATEILNDYDYELTAIPPERQFWSGAGWSTSALFGARYPTKAAAESTIARVFLKDAKIEACEHIFQCGASA